MAEAVDKDIFPVGNYTVIATPYSENGRGGDEGDSITINFELIDSTLTSTTLRTSLNLNPNPAQVEVVASLDSEIELDGINVFDLSGKLVKKLTSNEVRQYNERFVMDVHDLPVGTYIVLISDTLGNTRSSQLVIKR